MSFPYPRGRIALQNVVTGVVKLVRFASPEYHALRAQRHPQVTHRELWEQVVINPSPPKGDEQSGNASPTNEEEHGGR
jgi:hypothetical protein